MDIKREKKIGKILSDLNCEYLVKSLGDFEDEENHYIL